MSNFTNELAQTQDNEQRTAILESLDTAELKTFAENEFIPVNKRLGHKKLIAELVNTIAARFKQIDAGDEIYIPGLMGLPTLIDTPLIKARKEFNSAKKSATPAVIEAKTREVTTKTEPRKNSNYYKKLMSKKKLSADEILELLKISINGIPNFAPILEKGTIEIIREVNDRTITDARISTNYYTRKPQIIEHFNQELIKRLRKIQAHDIPVRREKRSYGSDSIIVRRYYDELTREWLELHRVNNDEDYGDQYITKNYINSTTDETPTVQEAPEIIDVEAAEIPETKTPEVKAIAAKTENNTVTPVPAEFYPLNFSEAVEELKNAYAPERTTYKGTPHYCQSPQTTVLNILCDCSNNTLFQIIELENLRYYWNDHKDNTTYFNENSPRDEIIRGIAEQLLQRMNYLVNKGSYFYDNLDAFAISRKTEILSAWINTYKRIYRHVLKDSPMPQNDERETPEFEDEFYSDFAGDNSHPEQDIPEDHEPDGANVNGTNLNLEEYRKEIAKLWQICNHAILPETAQPEQEAKPVIPAKPATPAKNKTRKQDTDSRVFQEIIRDLDALTPEEIINDTSKLDIICEDLQAVLSGMKKAQIIEFAAQHKISLLSLQYVKKKTIKDIAGYICKKLAMFKTIEAQQAITPKINKPVEPQISHVARTSQPSKSVNIPIKIIGRQIAVVLPGENFMFDFGTEAA